MNKQQTQLHKDLYRNYKTPEELEAIKSAKEKSKSRQSIQRTLIDNSKGSGAWRKIGELTDKIELSKSLGDHLERYDPVA